MLNSTKLNRIGLNRVAVNKLINITAPSVQTYTVDDLIQLGYLTAYGNENEGYRIDTAQPLPMPIKDIKDFDAVFIGRSVPASVDTQRACMFNLSDKSHLTESQQKEIISKYNNKPNDRAISQLLFRNYTLPNADLKIIQNKTTEDSWQYSHKMFEGSTFNNVELNIKGSISSTNKLFMGITCNELEIYANSSSGNNMVAGTDVIAPHDTTEMYASSAINKYPRGVSYYRGLANWTFTNNWNGKATEIPNVRGVETEEDRVTSPINVMKLPSGILYQTLWITSITRIGPVLDVTNVTGSEYLWGNCGIQLPNVTDIRIKNLDGGIHVYSDGPIEPKIFDWDFRGKAIDKVYIPKMDIDSIRYCLENTRKQSDINPIKGMEDMISSIWNTCTVVNTTVGDSWYGYHYDGMGDPDYILGDIYSPLLIKSKGVRIETTHPYGVLGIKMDDQDGDGFMCMDEIFITESMFYTTPTNHYKTSDDTEYFVVYLTSIGVKDELDSDVKVISIDEEGNETIINRKPQIHFSEETVKAEDAKSILGSSIEIAQSKGWDVYFGDTLIE